MSIEKVAILIDNGFLTKTCRSISNNSSGPKPKIDYQKLIDCLLPKESKLLRCYYYDCKIYVSNPPTQDEQERQSKQNKFLDRLNEIPQMELKFGRIEKYSSASEQKPIYIQKRVDIMFAMDLVTLSTKHLVDHIILITGDSDMIPAVQAAKNEGIIISLLASSSSTHQELRQTADIVIHFDMQFINSIAMNSSK